MEHSTVLVSIEVIVNQLHLHYSLDPVNRKLWFHKRLINSWTLFSVHSHRHNVANIFIKQRICQSILANATQLIQAGVLWSTNLRNLINMSRLHVRITPVYLQRLRVCQGCRGVGVWGCRGVEVVSDHMRGMARHRPSTARCHPAPMRDIPTCPATRGTPAICSTIHRNEKNPYLIWFWK